MSNPHRFVAEMNTFHVSVQAAEIETFERFNLNG